ncbi:MAG: HDOD domain-containing protein [Betaproteobacteria bacterium]|nr:HDOD domain-containing protein [Betaproteobacteria bacterium]
MHREEIIDERSRIAGYRFNTHWLTSKTAVDGASRLELLLKEAIGNLVQRRLAIIPINTQDWQAHDFRQLATPGTAFLVQAPISGCDEPGWLSILAEIRACGAKVALSGAAIGVSGALDAADLLILNFGDYSLEAFERVVSDIKRRYPSLQLMVENITSWAEHRLCQARGIPYSLGEFAAQADEEDTREKLNQSRLVLIELLQLLRQDADAAALADVAKRDPAVALKVVSMANSPAAGLGSSVASVDQAITVLGRSYLYRWLTISMFRIGGSPRDEGLLELALRRARFLEILAQNRLQKHEADELFLVGLLSLIEVLLGMPVDKVITGMNLPDSVTSVLVNSDGPYTRYLTLAIAVERGQMEHVAKVAGLLNLDALTVEAANYEAQRWTEQALTAGD